MTDSIQVLKYSRDPGFFSTTASPKLSPTTAAEWKDFLTTSRSKPLTHRWTHNLRAAVTVSLVSIPLSISLSIASGGTPEQGVITAFWGGLISSVFGGSQFNIVGPTGALSGLLSTVAARYGADILPILALYSSLILFIFLLFRADKWMQYVPASVCHGFSVGVSLALAVGRLGTGLGIENLPHTTTVSEKFAAVVTNINDAQPRDAAFFVAQTLLLYQCMKRWPRIPWIVFFTVLGIVLGKVLPIGSLILLNQQFPTIRATLYAPPELFRSLIHHGKLNLEGLSEMNHHLLDRELLIAALGIAVVALLESLLSARVANRMVADDEDGEELLRSYSSKREAFGLGLSNVCCAVAGGIPATAALARTSLNVRSGAFNRISTFFGTLLLAGLSLLFLSDFEYIPSSCVSSVLVITSYRMLELRELREIFACDKTSMFSVIFTTYCCIVTDTFSGLLLGTLVVVLLHYQWYRVFEGEVSEPSESIGGKTDPVLIVLKSSLVFLNLLEFEEFLHSVEIKYAEEERKQQQREQGHRSMSPFAQRDLVLDFTYCLQMDYDAVQVLGRWIRGVYRRNSFRSITLLNASHFGPATLHAIETLSSV